MVMEWAGAHGDLQFEHGLMKHGGFVVDAVIWNSRWCPNELGGCGAGDCELVKRWVFAMVELMMN